MNALAYPAKLILIGLAAVILISLFLSIEIFSWWLVGNATLYWLGYGLPDVESAILIGMPIQAFLGIIFFIVVIANAKSFWGGDH